MKNIYLIFVAGCKSLPMVIVHDPLRRLIRCNSETDGNSPDEKRLIKRRSP